MKRFDRVLVDAECSTNGSSKHYVQQRVLRTAAANTTGDDATASNPTLTDPRQLESLVALQKGLIQISSGFKLFKPGGVLVYSTCSLSIDQNEAVVEWLLEKHPKEAHVMPVSFSCASSRITEGSIMQSSRTMTSIQILTRWSSATGTATNSSSNTRARQLRITSNKASYRCLGQLNMSS